MKPAPFEYRPAESLEEATALLAEYGEEASLLAGGQSLIPAMNFRLAQPAVLIDLNPVRELSYIRVGDSGELRIGAMTRQRTVERSETVEQRSPLLHETMPQIAHPQIRNRGTIGGSIAHADPSAELPAVMTALDARFKLTSLEDGLRWIRARDFFTGMFATGRRSHELLTEIEIPPFPERTGWSFREIARRHGDYALLGVAALMTLDEEGLCKNLRLAYLSAGDGVVEAPEACASLAGKAVGKESVEQAATCAAFEEIEPLPDIHATEAYRRHLARVLTVQALRQAHLRAARS